METSLIDIIFLSDKRKNLMLLLSKEPQNRDDIRNKLNVTSSSVMPQIKILEENYLIVKENEYYHLTEIGEAIVDKLIPFLETLDIFEGYEDYWENRNFDPIPKNLLTRIRELGDYNIIEPDLDNLFEIPQELLDGLKESNSVTAISSIFHPNYPSIFLDLAKKGADITVILQKAVFSRLKVDFQDQSDAFINMENTDTLLYNDEMGVASILVTDKLIYLNLLDKNGKFNHNKIISYDDSAVKWGQELVQYYTNISTRITDMSEVSDG
ncbi:winged helix-turn-helix domain-containing protein [Methanohalobium sp.]|uniref:helix-turn-helix transcriptional regulator n=1 Tax=Methanohalobium sp. TaxID=2837493 RepID=UPI0025D78562|nr:winged helix-turn-helix domain-containing protein [Methanohalobium sp.]